jgi:hypothetical protein
MILLPRGNPVKEKIDPGKINLPEALRKLQSGTFTGYLRFETKTGTGVVIFEAGSLISALFEWARDGERLVNEAAFERIFEQSLAGGATLDIYRLSTELARSIHALLHGEVLYKGQDLKLIDIKALLAKLKQDQMSGCLRIYTREHVALIFYRDGNPLGFFHDGSTDIETTAGHSMSVAREPGAKIDVLLATNNGEGGAVNLLQTIDLLSVWQKIQDGVVRQRRTQVEEANRSKEVVEKDRQQKVLALLRGTAEKHIGKIGISLVEKEFDKGVPLGADTLFGFYERLAKAAKLVAGPSAVKTMVEEMQKGLGAFLK